MKYIPFNQEQHEALEQKLAKKKAYGSVDQFTMLYNESVLNKSNPEIVKIAEEIADTYKNIELKNKLFITHSPNKILLDTALAFLNVMPAVISLKRIAEELVEAEYEEDTKMIFMPGKQGVVHVERDVVQTEEVDGEYYDKDPEVVVFGPGEKLFKDNNELVSHMLLRPLVQVYENENYDGEMCYISLLDVLDMNDDFIEEIGTIIENAVRNSTKN